MKDLMITDQLKRRVHFDVREHFIDKCAKFCTSSEVLDLLQALSYSYSSNGKPGGRYFCENKLWGKTKAYPEEVKKGREKINAYQRYLHKNEEFERRKMARCHEQFC